jgi:hypothetical protein
LKGSIFNKSASSLQSLTWKLTSLTYKLNDDGSGGSSGGSGGGGVRSDEWGSVVRQLSDGFKQLKMHVDQDRISGEGTYADTRLLALNLLCVAKGSWQFSFPNGIPKNREVRHTRCCKPAHMFTWDTKHT